MQAMHTGPVGRWWRRAWIVVLVAFLAVGTSAEAAGFGRKSTGRKSSSSSSTSSSDSSSSSSGGSFGRRSSSSNSGGRNVATVRPSYGGSRQTVVAQPQGRVRRGGYTYVDPYPVPYGHVHVGWYDPFWGPWTGGYYSTWGVYPWGHYAYGYYPMWAAPPPPESGVADPSPVSMSLVGGLTLANVGPMPHLTMNLDAGPFGVSGKMMGLVSASVNGQPAELMPYWSGHVTWSVLNLPSARLRLEGGAAGIIAPDVTYVGPDLGGSVQLALAGPLGVEGSLHWMPFPASIVDAQANVALNFGGLTLRAGWRTMVLDDSGIANDGDGGTDVLNGPQLSVGVVF